MKKLIYIILPILFASACNRSGIEKLLNEVDTLIVHEQYDSADVLLSKIDTMFLSDIDKKAHFYLLKSQLASIMHHDGCIAMLDSLVIPYYNNVMDHRSLANAYYYKGYSKIRESSYAEAVFYLKKAEEQAMTTNDAKLQYKIAEILSYINDITGNYQLQLHYAHKALSHVQGIDNKKWEADALFNVGIAYSRLMREDSTLYYLSKMEPLLKHIPQSELPSFLINVAYLYKHSSPQKAKDYLKRSLTLKESSSAFEHLADIYYAEGDQEEAYRLWKRALSASGNNTRDNIIHNLLEYDIEHGRTENVCRQVNEIITIKDSVINCQKNDTIKDLQLRFDHEVAMRRQEKVANNWRMGLLLTVLLTLLLLSYFIINRYRETNKLQAAQMQINDLMDQIREQESIEKDNNDAIEKLNRQIESIMNKEGSILRNGKLLYDHIVAGRTVSGWSKKEYELFFNYYTAINYKKMNRLQKPVRKEKLTQQNLFYLILVEMGFDKKTIAGILGISESSVNTLKSRTKIVG